jgi:CheY-like chemotaxis protein
VLIDMQLPDIDGFEVLRRLRADASLDASLMVALSANGLSEDIARALAAGFDDYWTKPIDFKLFLLRIDGLMPQAASTRPSV